jgi:hypothetical protein
MKPGKEWCKHYNGLQNKTCKAGVEYDTVIVGRLTPGFSLPCMQDRNPQCVTCEKCEFPTPEEIAERKAEMERRFATVGKARSAIVEHLGGPWKRGMPGVGGKITCPVCGKADSLRFSRAGINGHIHASCQTVDCVSWME